MNLKQYGGVAPKTTNYELYFENLPLTFNGFKIAHISDAHSEINDKILPLISDAHPDIICFTGDLFHNSESPIDKIRQFVSDACEIAPIYMVTGNHDLWRYDGKKLMQSYERFGAVFLDDTSVKMKKDDDFITISGINDPFSRTPKLIERNLSDSLAKLLPSAGFNLLLFHRASLFDRIKNLGYDLILSGHMHGGQIRLPIIGGTLAPTSSVLSHRMIFPKYTFGQFSEGNTTMIVNRGMTNTMSIPRIGNPPEVGIITLKNPS